MIRHFQRSRSNPAGVREIDRLSEWLHRTLALVALLLIGSMIALANPVKYVGCTPSDGSSITSWDFTLTFDITDALAAAKESNPNDEVGIGVMALGSSQYTTLYKGSKEDNIVLGKALTKVVNGKSENFVVNGNTVNISFDITEPIVNGQKYTIEIKNDSYLYIKGSTSRI